MTFLAVAAPAWAVTVDECTDAGMCGAGTGSCTISSTVNVEPGSFLDCSGRDLTITGGGVLKVTDGDFVLLADDLTVYGPGGTITAVEGGEDTPGSIEIVLSGSLSLAGKIRANGAHGGGRISVHAIGNIVIPESGTDGIETDGTGADADGGEIELVAGGVVTIQDPIHSAGAGSGSTSGGLISIRAGGNISTNTDGHVSAEGVGGRGGEIIFSSDAGNIVLAEHVDVEGRGTYGDGGSIDISAAGSVQVSEQITARGGVNVSGGKAAGGRVVIESGCAGTTINAGIVATGGQLPGVASSAGGIALDSAGAISVAGGVVLDTHALSSNGNGGPIEVLAQGQVSLAASAKLDARGGSSSPGTGGTIRVEGCEVSLTASSVLDCTGYNGGAITLEARNVAAQTGAQPMRIPVGAQVRAAGNVAGGKGRVMLETARAKSGKCSNGAPCMVDSDCTSGCYTSVCTSPNPDTGGVDTQFDVVPERRSRFAEAACSTTCAE